LRLTFKGDAQPIILQPHDTTRAGGVTLVEGQLEPRWNSGGANHIHARADIREIANNARDYA